MRTARIALALLAVATGVACTTPITCVTISPAYSRDFTGTPEAPTTNCTEMPTTTTAPAPK